LTRGRSSFTCWRRRLRTPVEEAKLAFVDLELFGGAGAATPPALDLRIELSGGVVLHLVRR
jgi:hypothetical protein